MSRFQMVESRSGVDFINPKRQNLYYLKHFHCSISYKPYGQNFHNITPKNDDVFKVQFHNKNLALKMPKWASKTLTLPTCCSIIVAKKLAFLSQNIYFGVFTPLKNAGIKAFIKLTPGIQWLNKNTLMKSLTVEFMLTLEPQCTLEEVDDVVL